MRENSYISIDGQEIGVGFPPYVIAEMSANHNGSIETAFNIIKAAKHSGANAVKMQSYTPDTITVNCDSEEFRIKGGIWSGLTLYELYREAHTPFEWHQPLFSYANELGITLFSSPFDQTAVDLLEDLNAPAYKIASCEVIDIPLIKYVAGTGKPLIISTGMANEVEIEEAIDSARSNGCKQLALLHCVSGYPAPSEDYNLSTLAAIRSRFRCLTGLSDHTLGNSTAIAAVALGASIIEKHFTLDRNGGGADDSFSLEPDDLASLCSDAHEVWRAIGVAGFDVKPSERSNLQFRRSLYFVRDLKAGQAVSSEDVRSIRPGYGIPPKHLDATIGRVVKRDIVKHTPVNFSDFE